MRLLFLLLACNSTPLGLGQRCTVGESCAAGATCLDVQTIFVPSSDAGCSGAAAGGTICSRQCDAGSDCAALGSDLVCAQFGCGPLGLCLRRGDAGPAPAGR